MSALTILLTARGLINTADKWTKNAYHKEGNGGVVRHCALGAINQATPGVRGGYMKAIETLASFIPSLDSSFRRVIPKSVTWHDSIVFYNDTHDHADVLQKFDLAITHLRAEATLRQLKKDTLNGSGEDRKATERTGRHHQSRGRILQGQT